MSLRVAFCTFLAVLVILPGCSSFPSGDKDETVMEGKRVSVLKLQGGLEPDDILADAQGFVAPQPWENQFWPQAGGYPVHTMQHLALNEGALKEVARFNIGAGSSDILPLTAQPLVVDDVLFAMDSRAVVSAHDIKSGKRLWRVDAKDREEDDDVISGGLAYSRGRLYATNGYDEVLALSPENGKLLWRVQIPAPARAAPTIMDDRVFVTTLDNRLVALAADSGAVLWDFEGLAESAGLIGAASPAASSDVVIPAFSSGEVFALRVENGGVAWGENLSSLRGYGGLGGISDIKGLPVIDKGLVFAVSFGGRMVAIDKRTGNRVWQRDIGSAETPWLAGNYIFVLTTENQLVAVMRDTGQIRWVTDLPRFENEEARKGVVFWTGPILASNRLILAGTNGQLIEVMPDSGIILRETDIGKPVSLPLTIADRKLFMLADDGTVLIYE